VLSWDRPEAAEDPDPAVEAGPDDGETADVTPAAEDAAQIAA
jgi:hypothetical protein